MTSTTKIYPRIEKSTVCTVDCFPSLSAAIIAVRCTVPVEKTVTRLKTKRNNENGRVNTVERQRNTSREFAIYAGICMSLSFIAAPAVEAADGAHLQVVTTWYTVAAAIARVERRTVISTTGIRKSPSAIPRSSFENFSIMGLMKIDITTRNIT